MTTLIQLVGLLENVMDLVDAIKGPAGTREELDDELVARLARLAQRLAAVPARWQAYDDALSARIPKP